MTVVRCEVSGAIGRITLNRPAQMNAITIDLGRELEASVRELGSRADVSVVVLRGAGGNFSAGGDFHEVERLRAGGPDSLVPLFAHFAAACRAVTEIPQPVVAAVEGVAMAGGFELMQAADIALVREDARLRDNHVVYGQVPGGGGSQRLPRLVGRQRALGHLLSGDRLTAREAVEWGLAYRAYPSETFDESIEQFVQTMSTRRRDALVGIKRLVRAGLATTLDEGLDVELKAVVAHISGAAGGAGVSSFVSKRE